MVMLVDGYNLLHNLPECTYDLKHDLESARNYLISKLSRYASANDVEVKVIFDAQYTEHLKTSIKKQEGIKIVYTKTDETADNYIINWVKKRHQDEYIGVITSDQELSKAVQRLGCITRKTIEFDDTYRGIDAFAGRKGKLGSAMPDSRPLLGDRIGKSAFNGLKELKRKLEGK